jgi:hypothetical protein
MKCPKCKEQLGDNEMLALQHLWSHGLTMHEAFALYQKLLDTQLKVAVLVTPPLTQAIM